MKKLIEFIVVHCSATKEGRDHSEAWLRRVHCGPKDLSNGKVVWQGRTYTSRRALPDIVFYGVPLRLVKGNGWRQVGYWAMVKMDGGLVKLTENNLDEYVDPWEITNGAAGFNSRCVHVMYVGGLDASGNPKDTRTEAQKTTLINLLTGLKKAAPDAKIIGHRDLPGVAKACPSFDAKTEYQWIKWNH